MRPKESPSGAHRVRPISLSVAGLPDREDEKERISWVSWDFNNDEITSLEISKEIFKYFRDIVKGYEYQRIYLRISSDIFLGYSMGYYKD